MITAEEVGRWIIHPAAGVFLAKVATHFMRETVQRKVKRSVTWDPSTFDTYGRGFAG